MKRQNNQTISNLDHKIIKKIYEVQGISLDDDEVPSPTRLSRSNRMKLELVKENVLLESNGYGLYLITINYNQYERVHKLDDVQRYFNKFYHQKLVPLLVGNHATRNSKRHLWPEMTLCTEVCKQARNNESYKKQMKEGKNEPVLHHHAIVAIHPNHIDKFDQYVGLDMIPRDKHINMIESLDIRPADIYGILYCTKNGHQDLFTQKYGPILPEQYVLSSYLATQSEKPEQDEWDGTLSALFAEPVTIN